MYRIFSTLGVVLWMALLSPGLQANSRALDLVAPPGDQHTEGLAYGGERLSLNFQDIEVRSVLQLIADFTGLNLVASDSVQEASRCAWIMCPGTRRWTWYSRPRAWTSVGSATSC